MRADLRAEIQRKIAESFGKARGSSGTAGRVHGTVLQERAAEDRISA
jgi:hypothetical protein